MSIWDRFSGTGKSVTPAVSAKQRLQFVLVHDRNEIPPGLLELIKDDVIKAISRHISIDRRNVEVHVAHEATEGKLIVDIPLLRDDAPGGRSPGRTRAS